LLKCSITTVATATDIYDPVNPVLNATNKFLVVVKEVNVAPVLPVIAPQTVTALKLLTVTNTAAEPNIHATVGYTLVGAPSGMGIDGNGIITWTPSQAESPSTNLIVTVATSTNTLDQVNPHLSATNSFSVVVTGAVSPHNLSMKAAPSVEMGIRILTSNDLLISWPTATAGLTLQENSSLGTGEWVDATNIVSIVGTESQVLIAPAPGNRFFRLFRQ
jgi:hypothetical protein